MGCRGSRRRAKRNISPGRSSIARKRPREKNRKIWRRPSRKAWKKCISCHSPRGAMDLIEVEYKALKVARCSACDGVWLDAGELEAAVKLEKSVLSRFLGL